MFSSQLPAETVQHILDAIGDNKKASLKAATLAKIWLLQQRPTCFTKLLFHNEEDIFAFLGLISSPTCSFSLPIACNELLFEGLDGITNQGPTAIAAVVPRVTPPRSLTIGIVAGQIPKSVTRAMAMWKGSLRELKISGGTHDPNTFFTALSSLPYLASLTLEDFNFTPVTTWEGQGSTYAFPATLKVLSTIGDASPFQFFMHQIQSGGLRNIDTLYVKARFLLEDPGVESMLDAFRRSGTVSTIKLHPIYNPTCKSLSQDMWDIFSSPARPLLKIRGLRSLEIDFSDTPAEWALNCLSICAIYLPNRRNGLNVNIRVPRSLELWDEQGPTAQLEQLLEELDNENPLAREPPTSTIVVRDFPADLPERFKAAPTVCKFPVTFVGARA